ncbi:MAG: xylulokinase [Firmicutes bacterium]|jgi:xylulokinase|nr:xylulokinase [Bacillota bacterium]
MELVIGIDLATSGAKCVVMDKDAQVLAVAFTPYPLDTSEQGKAEQNPAEWWAATRRSIKEALQQANADPRAVQAIGLTGQMHGLVALDAAGEVIRPAIIWLDSRSIPQCEWLLENIGEEAIAKHTLNVPLTGFTGPKLLWLRDNEPESYARIAQIMLPKDYIRLRLTGVPGTDVSDASGTMLFDVARRTWSEELVRTLDIPLRWLPPAYESGEIVGNLLPEVATELGLRAGIPVIAGAGDQAAAGVACGALTEGVAAANIGSGGIVFIAMDSPKVDPSFGVHTFCHAVEGKWHLLGVVQTAGLALKWFTKTFCREEAAAAEICDKNVYDVLLQKASHVPPGCEGLVFLPYLMGERSPHRDPNARGVFFGAQLHHGKEYFTRAVLEGVAFAMRDCVETARQMGVKLDTYYTGAGGGYQGRLWRQIQADIFGANLVTLNVQESSASGAAMLAGHACGLYESLEAAYRAGVQPLWYTEYDESNHARYQSLYTVYRRLYTNLRSLFKELA